MPNEELAVVETRLMELNRRANEILVVDAGSYAEACQLVLVARKEIKNIGFALDPGIASAKAHLDDLKFQKSVHVDKWTPTVSLCEQKAEAYKAEERRKAAAEQERLNALARVEAQRKADEERKAAEAQAKLDREKREKELEEARKAGEINKREQEKLRKQAEADEKAARELAAKQAVETAADVKTVTVAPDVPKVAGIRARVNWKFRIKDAKKLPRNFLMADEVAIGAEVRRMKNKEQAETAIPGIEVYCEDSI